MNPRRAAFTVILVLAVASACSGGAAPSTASNPLLPGTLQPGATAASATAANATNGPVTGHVGDKLTFTEVGGATADGTLVKIFDPVTDTDAHPATLPPATHWVGVEMILDNHSPDYVGESSLVDATTSAGATVLEGDPANGGSLIYGFAGCTQTDGDEEDVQPYTHCYAFVVPDGQTITRIGVKVGESATFSVGSDQAVWMVP